MTRRTSAAPLLLLLAAACGDAARDEPGAESARIDTALPSSGLTRDTAGLRAATALVRDSVGRELGTLTLVAADSGISVEGRLTGLPPGEHAIHLHTVGNCVPPSFEAAGGHWNPTDAQHGTEAEGGPHYGDLPNFTVGDDSSGMVQGTTAGGSLRDSTALLDGDGAAVVVHAGPDDYRSQPSGNSGPPIACGPVAG